MLLPRRLFLVAVSSVFFFANCHYAFASSFEPTQQQLQKPLVNEGLIEYLERNQGSFQLENYKRWLGAANEYKEGDEILGIAATTPEHRDLARALLTNTRLNQIDAHPPQQDELYRSLKSSWDLEQHRHTAEWTLGQLKQYLLEKDAVDSQNIAAGLSSDVIACVFKLMSNAELTTVVAKGLNPLP